MGVGEWGHGCRASVKRGEGGFQVSALATWQMMPPLSKSSNRGGAVGLRMEDEAFQLGLIRFWLGCVRGPYRAMHGDAH